MSNPYQRVTTVTLVVLVTSGLNSQQEEEMAVLSGKLSVTTEDIQRSKRKNGQVCLM